MRWNIWDEFERLQEELDNTFYNYFPRRNQNLLEGPKDVVNSGYKRPLADMYETEKEYIVEVELPGVDKKDIKIDIKDDLVNISVEKNDESEITDKKKGIYRMERRYTGFQRVLHLPKNTNKENVDAEYKNGILKLKIPKKEIKDKDVKRITVK